MIEIVMIILAIACLSVLFYDKAEYYQRESIKYKRHRYDRHKERRAKGQRNADE